MHKPVLLKEVIEYLDLRPGEIVVDATVGSGGHAGKICQAIGEKGTLIGIDQDSDALGDLDSSLETKSLSEKCQSVLIEGNFRNLDKLLKKEGIEKVDKILFDLGLRSEQLEESGRGFSFLRDEPLLMTFKKNPSDTDLTAYKIVNQWREEEIADVIYKYGEERLSRRIAKRIVEARKREKIQTTRQLAEIIGERRGRIHPATKTFQALRIVVNDELGALEEGLEKSWEALAPNGRIAVISFHSLEDRIVKNFFSALGGSASGGRDKVTKILTKKPIIPTKSEIETNPRSRSSKLRVIEKI